MASGGLPVHKLGASDFALRVARKFNIEVTETAPGLVPLTITGKEADWFAALSGNSVFSTVSTKEISFQENILFTHWGLSGPAILQISSYVKPGEEIEIDLLPNQSIADLISKERAAGGKRLLIHVLHDHFTKRFSEALGKFLPIDTKIASMSKKDALLVNDTIHHFKVKIAGNKGYDKAEVMLGGVSTKELHPESLEALKVSGLYFGGECVDVTGWLGGYNFQWAWASGVLIARNL
jgi:predicted Rossmann fold flavoprotein